MRTSNDVELAALYEVPLLNKEQEQYLFRQMNYLKHKAHRLRSRLDPSRARTQELDEIEAPCAGPGAADQGPAD